MIRDNVINVVAFRFRVQLSKVIDQRSHTRREVQHTIHKLTQGDFPYKTRYGKKWHGSGSQLSVTEIVQVCT